MYEVRAYSNGNPHQYFFADYREAEKEFDRQVEYGNDVELYYSMYEDNEWKPALLKVHIE